MTHRFTLSAGGNGIFFFFERKASTFFNPLPLNAANNVRRSENEGESDEITEQNPRQQDVRQLATRRANYRRVVVLEKHAADEQRYLFDRETVFIGFAFGTSYRKRDALFSNFHFGEE